MSNRDYVIADLHLGHTGALKWRTQFATMEEHDNYILAQWRDTVRVNDRVFVLGDVAFNVGGLRKMIGLPGRKVLVGGNHDQLPMKWYNEIFSRIRGVSEMQLADGRRAVLTHVPIHPNEVSELGRWDLNIHGHLHDKCIGNDERYMCVSCEQVRYRPRLVRTLKLVKQEEYEWANRNKTKRSTP